MAGRILIVDDDTNVREVLIQRLRRRGYDVAGAADGVEAVNLVASGGFALLVIDLLMPRATGPEVIQALAGIPNAPPFIVVSGVADLWSVRNSPPGCIGALTKPVDLEQLVRLIPPTVSPGSGEHTARPAFA